MNRDARLHRTTFRTSREMDFFSEKELVAQTGHPIEEWPLVFLKETIDNGLDACEDSEIAPEIDVSADAGGITVCDNGPGLPEATLKGVLDFTMRVSNREMYVAPTRGAQGNALQTILAMPVVLDPRCGRLIVTIDGKRHTITCGADPITQRAVVHDDVSAVPKCKKRHSERTTKKQGLSFGTEMRIEWNERRDPQGDVLWPFADLYPLRSHNGCWGPTFAERFRAMLEGFAFFNPHATIHLDWFGERTTWQSTDREWEKWKPFSPTSSHWYEVRHLERLIGAYIAHDRDNESDRLVSDFLAEFDGLTGSQKRAKVLGETGLKRIRLSELVRGDRLDGDRIAGMLASMQQHTRPVKAKRLGLIGEEHLRTRLLAMDVQPESFRYTRKLGDGKCKKTQIASAGESKLYSTVPWVLESAFGWKGEASEDRRSIFAGANWSAAIKNPFRSFAATGEGLEAALSDLKAGAHEPIVYVLHLAHPRVEHADRGKSTILIGGAA